MKLQGISLLILVGFLLGATIAVPLWGGWAFWPHALQILAAFYGGPAQASLAGAWKGWAHWSTSLGPLVGKSWYGYNPNTLLSGLSRGNGADWFGCTLFPRMFWGNSLVSLFDISWPNSFWGHTPTTNLSSLLDSSWSWSYWNNSRLRSTLFDSGWGTWSRTAFWSEDIINSWWNTLQARFWAQWGY
ncbi:MAG TPA: hypothetical protein VKR06_22650 [Ktedonosporobacter sp.]|nr:hypothetical protein [Ktedonosporobacter sp.]